METLSDSQVTVVPNESQSASGENTDSTPRYVSSGYIPRWRDRIVHTKHLLRFKSPLIEQHTFSLLSTFIDVLLLEILQIKYCQSRLHFGCICWNYYWFTNFAKKKSHLQYVRKMIYFVVCSIRFTLFSWLIFIQFSHGIGCCDNVDISILFKSCSNSHKVSPVTHLVSHTISLVSPTSSCWCSSNLNKNMVELLSQT